MLFESDEGKRLGLVRLVKISQSDPRIGEIVRLQRKLDRTKGRPFFYGWRILREYSHRELADADLLVLQVRSTFEPAGEECGTTYDDSAACAICGADAPQTSDLRLNIARIPQTRSITRTMAGEIVIASSLAKRLIRTGVLRSCFRSLRNHKDDTVSKAWSQLLVPEASIEIAPATRFGIELFATAAESKEYQCPLGDVLGLARLSEAYVVRGSYHGEHLTASAQFVGVRRGLLRPERLLFISAKVWEVLDRQKIRGIGVEVAHLV
jgi:hypothetical protein